MDQIVYLEDLINLNHRNHNNNNMVSMKRKKMMMMVICGVLLINLQISFKHKSNKIK